MKTTSIIRKPINKLAAQVTGPCLSKKQVQQFPKAKVIDAILSGEQPLIASGVKIGHFTFHGLTLKGLAMGRCDCGDLTVLPVPVVLAAARPGAGAKFRMRAACQTCVRVGKRHVETEVDRVKATRDADVALG